MSRAGSLVGLGLVAAIAACASAGGPEVRPRPAEPVQVEVTNHGMTNVVVYAHLGGQSHRLGEATPLGDASLSLPPVLTAAGVRVRFLVVAIDGRFLSGDFLLDEDDVVTIHVQPNIRQSTVSIR